MTRGFVRYEAAELSGAAIDWDAPVEISDDLRAALAPRQVDAWRAGRLRGAFGDHPAGAIVLASPDDRAFYVEADAEDALDGDDDGGDDGGDDDGAGGRVYALAIDAAHAGERLDAAIAAAVPALSRARVQRLLEAGCVTVAGAVAAKASARVRAGDAIEVRVPPSAPLDVRPEPIPLAILYEDADLIVVDKPAGLVVHPAAGHAGGTLVNALLYHCADLAGIGGVLRPGIVHRLDKDTSGALVATKTERAHASLTAQFAAKSRGEPGGVAREYLGITAPAPATATGTLRTHYGRHPVDRKRFSSKVATGKVAVTHWEIVERLHGAALVRFVLETGRTHQIRVHAADAGWPLLGDPVYGRTPRDAQLAAVARALGRQALHAHTLAFAHPATGARMSFTAPIPEDLARARDGVH